MGTYARGVWIYDESETDRIADLRLLSEDQSVYGEWVELGCASFGRGNALACGSFDSVEYEFERSLGFNKPDGTPTGNFDVQPYVPGKNCPAWTQEFALKALRWERHLEFATEGKWFFDLVRWGIADTYMNNYFTIEKTRRSYLKDARFTKNRDEYFPIHQKQISYVKGLYKQNYGW